jgi:hypothetical protein
VLALRPQMVCYSWITGIAELAQVVFVRKRLVEVQYLRTTISEEQRRNSACPSKTRLARLNLPDSRRTAASGFQRIRAAVAPTWAYVSDDET